MQSSKIVEMRVFGGRMGEPVRQGDIDEVIRLSNDIADLEAALSALAENILARMADEPVQRIGVHKIAVVRERRGAVRRTALEIDGVERWRRSIR